MSAIELRPDEDVASYQRRRDIARSNFFMVERGHEEDDSSFRKRLDAMADSVRNTGRNWAERSGNARAAVEDKARQATDSAKARYSESPLIGGLISAAIGVAVGSALPLTRQEQEKLSGAGGKARDFVSEHKDQLTAPTDREKGSAARKGRCGVSPIDRRPE